MRRGRRWIERCFERVRGQVVADVYIYYFMSWDHTAHRMVRSARPATRNAIQGKGEPILESQLVVDHTELDDGEFLIVAAGRASSGADELTAQIKSLEIRAASRDAEVSRLDEITEGRTKYILRLESRVLRAEARALKDRLKSLLENKRER